MAATACLIEMTEEKGDFWMKDVMVLVPRWWSKVFCGVFACMTIQSLPVAAQVLSDQEQLGKSIFLDVNLSINKNQSCAECHGPEVGWTGPSSAINAGGAVYEGSIPGRFGNRKPPSAAYATFSPVFFFDAPKGDFAGGNFWDGRATGELLGNPAADQAQGPFLNPVEQALPDSACVVYRVCNPTVPGDYPVSFDDVWGTDVCTISWPADIDAVCAVEGGVVVLSAEDRALSDLNFNRVALSIAAYEASFEVNAFTSKYDCYLAGRVRLTKQEQKGRNLFRGKAKCARCHTINTGPGRQPPLFTDFTYDNLGVPKNPDNPWYDMPPEFNPDGDAWVDPGLGGFLATRPEYAARAAENMGKHKVPTLRNVARKPSSDVVKAYTHNGYFKTLWQTVHFYNTRDAKPVCGASLTVEEALAQDCWPAPEVLANVNNRELGDLGLRLAEEQALVAFMETLSDGFVCPSGP